MGFQKRDDDKLTEQALIDAILDPPAPSFAGLSRDEHPLAYILAKVTTQGHEKLDRTDKDFIAGLTRLALLRDETGQELKKATE